MPRIKLFSLLWSLLMLTSLVSATVYTATVAKDMNFDDPQATQNDVNISVGNAERNSMIKVKFDPVPWLIYDTAVDYYRLHFVGPSAWAGVGKTGHVTNTSSSNTQNNNRMNW